MSENLLDDVLTIVLILGAIMSLLAIPVVLFVAFKPKRKAGQ